MRKCIRCETPMVEDLELKVEGTAQRIKVTQPGIFKESLGTVCCAICPKCGYTELVLQDLSKIKDL